MSLLGLFSAALIAYLSGSLPTGFLVARAKGVDIRKAGSGNMGATNVFRVLGKGPGIFVLLVDALKGALPVLVLPSRLSRPALGSPDPSWIALVATLCAVLGHNYTCWLGFKGGKGVATSAGAFAALVPGALLATVAVWLLVFAASRYVSLASVCAAGALPVAAALTHRPLPVVVLTLVLSLLAIWKHKPNLQRLLAGTEARFVKKPAASAAPEEVRR